MFEMFIIKCWGWGQLKKISLPQSVSFTDLNTDKPAVLAAAKGSRTTQEPEPLGVHVLGPFLDIPEGVRTTGLP